VRQILTERRYRLSLTDLRIFLMARGRRQQSSDRRRGLFDRSELLTFRLLELSKYRQPIFAPPAAPLQPLGPFG
jgi:hypothetical protein